VRQVDVVSFFRESAGTSEEDWSYLLPKMKGIHRGMSIELPEDVHNVVHETQAYSHEKRAKALLDHIQQSGSGGLGKHWSSDEKTATKFATGNHQPGRTKVVIHAHTPDLKHIENDPDKLVEHGIFRHDNGMVGEREVPLKEGAPVHVHSVTWYGPRNKKTKVELHSFDGHHTASRLDAVSFFKQADEDYKLQHHAPGPGYGHALHQLGEPGNVYPTDVHEHHDWYDSRDDPHTLRAMTQARGKPDHQVTVYRAVPHGVKSINKGDWVSLSPSYARDHGRQNDAKDDWPTLKAKVPAKHLFGEGSLQEWGYHGPTVEQAQVHYRGGSNGRMAAATTIHYLHNTEKSPNAGSRFGQDIEPHGRYLVEAGPNAKPDERWEKGSVTFQNPKHIPFGGGYQEESNWKHQLSKEHGGKKGRELSQAVRDAGHDGIITHDDYGTSEIVDLTHLKPRTATQEPKAPVEFRTEGVQETKKPTSPVEDSVGNITRNYKFADGQSWDEVKANYDTSHPAHREMHEDVRRNGIREPIVVDYNQDPPEVVDGHTRLMHAEALGMDKVPVRHNTFADHHYYGTQADYEPPGKTAFYHGTAVEGVLSIEPAPGGYAYATTDLEAARAHALRAAEASGKSPVVYEVTPRGAVEQHGAEAWTQASWKVTGDI
jgi:hypothetical protein